MQACVEQHLGQLNHRGGCHVCTIKELIEKACMNMKAMAYIALVLSLLSYGLLVVWLLRLAYFGGITNVPQMLYSLGWNAVVFSGLLITLGTGFLVVGSFFASASGKK
jgi:hypothetical protein